MNATTSRPPAFGRPTRLTVRPALASWLSSRRVPPQALAEATRALAVMVDARLALLEAIETAAATTSHRRLREALEGTAARVRGGSSFADALAAHSDTFGLSFTRAVAVGEMAGTLGDVLHRLASHLERAEWLRRRVRAALTYPAVVLAVTVSAVAFLLTVIVPTFATLFQEFDAELPAPTRAVLEFADAVRSYGALMLLVVVVLVVAVTRWVRSTHGKGWLDRIVLRLPAFGPLVRKSLSAQFCRTMSTLIRSGVELETALATASATASNTVAAESIDAMRRRVLRGGTVAHTSIVESDVFPALVTQMVRVGEATARLDEVFEHVAEHYEREVETTLESLTQLVEPALIVGIGLVVGGILVALYLPMFDLATVIE